MKAHLSGHDSLAEMVSTHIEVWRDALKEQREKASLSTFGASQVSYINHELRALDAIEKACEVEQGL